MAGCSPYPTTENMVTSCTAANTGGLLADATGATLQVESGASVTGGSPAAITVASNTPSSNYTGNDIFVAVAGTVDGLSGTGILVRSGTTPTVYSSTAFYGSTFAHVTVGVNGVIAGASAVRVEPVPSGDLAVAEIDNSGSIRSTAGPSLLATNGGLFSSITNQASGTIGGIAGGLSLLTNAGTIDGESGSAVASDGSLYFGTSITIDNSGSILSASSGATIAVPRLYTRLTNNGSIANAAAGPALTANFLILDNGATGSITSAGGTAVSATRIGLTNRGTISGSVIAAPDVNGYASVVDSSGGGRIVGDVLLGDADDTVVASYRDGSLDTGITGRVDAGGGTDQLRIDFHANATLAAPLTLPATFEQLAIGLFDGAAVTLADGFTAPSTLFLAGLGKGSLVNDTTIVSSGPAIMAAYPSLSFAFTNNGSISANLTQLADYALDFQYGGRDFTNNGAITAIGGNGVRPGYGDFVNTGSISASGTAVSIFGAPFTNSGTISSSGGIGLVLAQGSPTLTDTNTGLIEGGTVGAILNNDRFNNYGTIRSDGTGVQLSFYGGIFNRQGGTITGVQYGITGGSYDRSAQGAIILNAGTINGTVDLGSNGYASGNGYVALSGGVLNGNLILGSGGDVFVTELVNSGPGTYAGVTGTVSGGGYETIRYRVAADTSATITPSTGFAATGYELVGGVTLTLTAPGPLDTSLSLAGVGKVDLSADLSQSGHALITTTTALSDPDRDLTMPAHAVDIVSHGMLSASNASNGPVGAGVMLDSGDSFTNTGTVAVSAPAGSFGGSSAVFGGAKVINSGQILLGGSYGVANATALDNRGSITQMVGTADSIGVLGVGQILNSGTISTGGSAIVLSYFFGSSSIDNQAVLASSDDAAISGLFGAIQLTNRASGTISGGAGADAIHVSSGSRIINAGTINGNVELDSPYGSFFGGNVYEAAGGTLNGNLRFGATDDLFIAQSGATGVTGTIDAGDGRDTYARAFTSNATATLGGALPDTFEAEGIVASGADTTVTLVGPAGGIARPVSLYGDGAIVDHVDIAASPSDGPENRVVLARPPVGDGSSALAFTNQARIADGVGGTARSFTNTGTIGAGSLDPVAVRIAGVAEQPFAFANSGMIQASGGGEALYHGDRPAVLLTQDRVDYSSTFAPGTVTIANSGTIDGGLGAPFLHAMTLDFQNSGVITRGNDLVASVSLGSTLDYADATDGPAVRGTNSNRITATGQGATGLVLYGARYGLVADSGHAGTTMLNLANSGAISANGGGTLVTEGSPFFAPSVAVALFADAGAAITVTNAPGGTIAATGGGSVAVAVRSNGTFELSNAGTISGGPGVTLSTPGEPVVGNLFTLPAGYLAGAVEVVGATSTIRNSGTITGSILLDAGDDRIINSGTIDGDVFLVAGEDSFTTLASAKLTGRIDGGDDVNVLVLDTTGSTAATPFDLSRFVAFGTLSISGSGALALAGALPFATVQLAGGELDIAPGTMLSTLGPITITGSSQADTVVNRGTVSGSIDLGAGNDRLENRGTVSGSVMLGAGDDTYAVYAGAGAVSVDGGAGIDTIELHSAGSDASPTPFSAAGLSAFERLAQQEGVTSLSGEIAFDQVAVNGGRLVGLSGSTLRAAGGIFVAAGATFGSAGSVVGNIAVAGTLSPGASPGTMAVTGNVALSSGSTSLFELTPTVSDKLLVSGTLSIASGAVLTLVGSRPLTPGAALDLIVANGGIAGSFTTINQPATILGFLRQSANAIQLFGQFDATGFNPQVTATINYVNGVLVGGTASPALIAALPKLLTSGNATNGAAFARLNPEAYASATQISIENGLTLAKAARSGTAATSRDEAGIFTFAQGLGNWRPLDGSAAQGTSRARTDSYGLLGGIGFGSAEASIGGFVGYLDSHQRIAALGARTESDGIVAGLLGHAAVAGFDLSALLAYDGGKADTRRALPGELTAAGRYQLRGWVSDTSIGYVMPLGTGWSLKPEAGLTYVASRRGAAVENGGGAFSLDVARRESHATFVDGALTVQGGTAPEATFHPWISAGIRHQLNGRATLATASFAGAGGEFSVPGVARKATLATAGAGASFTLTPGLELFAAYRGEFGSDGTGTNLNGGMKLRF